LSLLKNWKIWIPVLTLVGIAVGILAARMSAPAQDDLVIQPPPAAKIGALELPARTRALEGRVVDPSGAGVAEALVWIRAGDAPHFTYTDAQGAFRFEALEAPPWRATVLAQGFPPLAHEFVESQEPQSVQLGARLQPPPELPRIARARLAGSIASKLATVLEGSEVVLTPTSPPETLSAPLPRRAKVAADGRFEFEDLVVGEYKVEVIPAWARGGSWPDLARAIDGAEPRVLAHAADAPPLAPLSIDLAIGEATGRLLDIDGEPIEGALLLFAPAADASRVFPPETSAADGTFALRGLPAGDYLLSIRAGSAAVQKELRIRAGESTAIELAPVEVHRSQ
jgi:hypothetical protein